MRNHCHRCRNSRPKLKTMEDGNAMEGDRQVVLVQTDRASFLPGAILRGSGRNEYLPHSWDVCKSVYHTNAKGAVFSNFLPAHGAETKNCRVTAEGTRSRSVVLLRTLNFFEVVG